MIRKRVQRWLQPTTRVSPLHKHNHLAVLPPRNGRPLAHENSAGPELKRVIVDHTITKRELIGASLNWIKCIVVMTLILPQLLTVFWSSSVTSRDRLYGRHPLLGPFSIDGENDEPFSDRLLVCIRRGRRFKILSVNEALAEKSTVIEDSTGIATHGYRVVNRIGHAVNDETRDWYSKTCSVFNATLDYMFSVCRVLGYANVTQDDLRIVDGVESQAVKRIANSLPVIIMPYWDNNLNSRYAIPAWDGHACMFRLSGKYEQPGIETAFMYTVNRTVRETKTVEWLGRPGGTWKNGWYEDLKGSRWYSDLLSTNPFNSDGIGARYFDMFARQEIGCPRGRSCVPQRIDSSWGANLDTEYLLWWQDLVAISNGSRYGFFYVKFHGINIVTCVYDLATFISDASVILLVMRWILCMVALNRGYRKGVSKWHNAGFGCVATSYTFNALPLTLLPRLKMILAAFFTLGCEFEGPQQALSDSWFVMYPALVEMVLVYSSLLNILARAIRRRMSCWPVTVTILMLGALHWIRSAIGASQRFGFDGRVSTVVSVEEFNALTVLDLFTTDAALRMNGNIVSIFTIKLILLAANGLALIFSEDMTTSSDRSKGHRSCGIETALAVRACNVGGYGRSTLYINLNSRSSTTGTILALNPYELVRLGYVVVSDRYLIALHDWMILVIVGPLCRIFKWRNYRILVFELAQNDDSASCGYARIEKHPQIISVGDPRLLGGNFWDIDGRPIE